LEYEDSYFVVPGGFPLADTASDYSRASRTATKRGYRRNDGLISSVARRKALGLLQLEMQIISLTVDGFSTKETAERIGINETALGVQLSSIYQKLHVSNQFELILFAVYHQLIDS
jgi:DNA-binding CsgD family transcriptional regulator